MVKTIIHIDKATIKRNPNAFNEILVVPGVVEINFSLKGEMPTEFRKLTEGKNPSIFVSEWHTYGNDIIEYGGFITDEGTLEKVKHTKGLTYTIDKNFIKVRHRPEPEYLYEYENPEVECYQCHSKVHINDIEEDCNDDGCWIICPFCNEINSFNFEYEKFTPSLAFSE